MRKRREGLAWPISSREMTDCLVPIFSASLVWVKPRFILASITALIKANSGCNRSYSALIFGSFKDCFKNVLKFRGRFLI